MFTDRGVVELNNPKVTDEPPKTFTFDAIYDWNSTQRDFYDETVEPLVASVLNGFNGTIFAYGQTGTGKTYTMEGERDNPEKRGVIPNSFEHIFNHIARSENQQYLVRASYLEIYQEEIRDLLHKDQKKRLELKERPDIGIYVKDLSSFVTKSVQEIEHVMTVGNQNRSVGSTKMNEHSSRSHAIFIITIECSEPGPDNKNHIRVGRLNLVDLAGSERQAKTGATGARFNEATKINLSLSALGNVISALVDGKSTHIPYRDSKLTRLLQDSLGGNAKTIMIANFGPASYNFEETLGTLRYANRAKNIKNQPKINEDPKDALLREFQEEISRLKEMLDTKGGGGKKQKRKKVRVLESGQSVTEEDDGEEEEEGDGEEEYMKQQQARLEQEKQAILHNNNIIEEEKAKILTGLEERAAQLQKEKDAQQAMASKIKAMQSKLLSGGKNIVDHTNEQERVIESKTHDIAEQKRKEREILQQLENQEESTVEIQQTYSSLQQEVEIKTKKLKKLFAKLQQVKAEIRDLHGEHSSERQELENTITELTKELKLKILIIDNFVPSDVRQRVLDRAVYDEDDDNWRLVSIDKAQNQQSNSSSQSTQTPKVLSFGRRPVSVLGSRRPQTDFARVSAAMGSGEGRSVFRFMGENIILLKIDPPQRTTTDYRAPDVAPGLQDALDAAMREEETKERSILIDASRLPGATPPPAPNPKSRVPKSVPKNARAAHTAPKANAAYPKSRGLVTAK